jgi:hypothetical protein
MAWVVRSVRALARFGVDFLFGDSIVLFPATLVVVGAAYGLRHTRVAAILVVPLLVVVVIAVASIIGRAQPSKSKRPDDADSEPT